MGPEQNKHIDIEPALAADIIKTWKDDSKVRAEFKSLNAYRAYRVNESKRPKLHVV